MPEDELTSAATDADQHVRLLTDGEIDIEGRMPWSSNATFLVTLRCGETTGQAIYKPLRGERPLWDFPAGLYRREVAAYRLSQAMGLGLVPPTIVRDGPLGEGSLQWYVDADHEQHFFTIYETRQDLHPRLAAMAAFDIVANNTDRKSGHCLIDRDGAIWGIDHGLCFSAEFKLRTVIWEFGGSPVPDELQPVLARIAESVPLEVATMLDDEEVAAVAERAHWLLDRGTFPIDATGRRYPWPLV